MPEGTNLMSKVVNRFLIVKACPIEGYCEPDLAYDKNTKMDWITFRKS